SQVGGGGGWGHECGGGRRNKIGGARHVSRQHFDVYGTTKPVRGLDDRYPGIIHSVRASDFQRLLERRYDCLPVVAQPAQELGRSSPNDDVVRFELRQEYIAKVRNRGFNVGQRFQNLRDRSRVRLAIGLAREQRQQRDTAAI